MSAALTGGELTIVAALVRTGLSAPAATLALVMITRDHARPASELADIVRQYQNLEDRAVAELAIDELRRMGWIVDSESYGLHLMHQAPDLREAVAGRLADATISRRLLEMRSSLEPNVRIVGPMKERLVYETYLDALRRAQREICLPMLATSPRLSSVPILQERARHGVRVRILLGTPELVAKLRGETMKSVARDAIHGWRENAEGYSTIQVRLSDSAEDLQMATCMTVDGQLLRFDVYDPRRQRSLEGVMVEVESPTGLELNLVSLFQRHFEEAWKRAKAVSLTGAAWWWISRGWQWYCFLIFTWLTFLFKKSGWAGILGSAAATFLVNALVSSWSKIRLFLRF